LKHVSKAKVSVQPNYQKIVKNYLKQIILKRGIIRVIISFLLGLLSGYYLGLLRVHEKITFYVKLSQFGEYRIQVISIFDQKIWRLLSSFSPSLGFASDVIAYQAAIVAIAIPVSLEIISRVSERYQSGAVTREFNQQWQLRTLLVLVVTDALFGVTLKFFVSSEQINIAAWKVIAWIVFIFFIATNVVLFAFFDNLRQYVTKTKFLLDRLFNDLNLNLKGATTKRQNNKAKQGIYQERIISAIEGIGDILIFESKNKKNTRFVRDSIWKLEERAKYIFRLQETNPETFKELMYSQKFLELNKSTISENELARAVALEINPEENVALLGAIANQFIRLHEAAWESNNFEVAQWTAYSLKQLLKDVSQGSGKYPLVKTLLRVLYDLHYVNRDKRHDLVYPLAVGWYLDIVPNKLFNIDYLEEFDNLFIQNLRRIIFSQRYSLLDNFLSSLNSAGGFNYFNNHSIDRLNPKLFSIDMLKYQELNKTSRFREETDELKKILAELRNVEQLDKTLRILENIRIITNNYFDLDEQIQVHLSLIKDELISAFKFNHIVDILFDLSAYCIFKGRYDYLQKIWTFKQPSDSDAIWVGSDFTLLKSSHEELISFYFGASW
jgi:hypothetical protein